MTGYFDILPDFHRHFGINQANESDRSGTPRNKPAQQATAQRSDSQRIPSFSSVPRSPSSRVTETVPASPTPSDPRVQNVGTVQFSRPQELRGKDIPAGASGADTLRRLPPFPANSIITPCSTFKPLDSGDPFHDEVALSLVGCFLLSVAIMFGGLFLLTSYLL